MKSKKSSSDSVYYFKIMAILALCFSFCIGTYTWIHHQALTENEQILLQQDKMINKIKQKASELETTINQKIEEIKTEKPGKEEPSLSNQQSTSENHNPDDKEAMFTPTDPKKFPSFKQLIGFKEELQAVEGFMDYLKNKSNYQNIGEVESPLGILRARINASLQ
ncbi:hypothetical protein [Rhus yellows phytoplasma]